MARRSPTSATETDRRFPIRVKVAIPPTGLGSVIEEAERWLRRELGPGRYGQSPATSIGTDACAYHFTSLADAQRFLEAFPQLELATPRAVPPPQPTGY